MDRIKILLLAIHYPFAIKNYFENAIRRNPNLDLVTTGPFTGSWTPWKGGMKLADKYAASPTYPLPLRPDVQRVNYELVRAQIPDKWNPDLVLTIDAGINWVNKPTDGIVATVATDGHCLNYSHARDISDYFFNLHPAYSMSGDILLSYAYDPEVHFAMSDIEKDSDAVLIGMLYEHRVNWVRRLRDAGVSVLFENGPVFDEYRILNNRARIGLNWASMDDTNARVFELMAMRLCPVINRTPDLARYGFIEGEHFLGFSNLDEAVEKVLWAKNEPEWAAATALAAYNKVHHDNFTYDKLVSDILKKCGLQ